MNKNEYEKVIEILKKDKECSLLEFQKALSHQLRIFYNDYQTLKSYKNDDELFEISIETLTNIFYILEKNDIKF